jgi:hypothetical protein
MAGVVATSARAAQARTARAASKERVLALFI